MKARGQLLICSGEGMGKTFLCQQVYNCLMSEGFTIAFIEPASPKQMLMEIADALGIPTKNLEGRAISADGLKAAIAQFLATNPAFLIFDDAHLLEAKFRQWLKSLKKLETPLLLAATNPPRTDIFINVPRIELQPLPDHAIRELMETAAIEKGISLRPSEFSRLQERVGGNPMLACRIIEEEYLGLESEAGDHTRYFDITPLICLVGIFFITLRFIGLGTNDQALYIFGGIASAIFIGFTLAIRSLPKESRRITS
ncbi:ATP-binding protein [Pannus brasiliensis CCIBt3594]|uniref:ATP-binding protein n=1 Tax=Pannus brasiliensis CCIBt3594 TaxID=1427578 RepID=A0AAW9R0Y3_9CHRO